VERGCVVLDQPQHVRKPNCGLASSVLGLSKLLRLVEDDTAALLLLQLRRAALYRRFV
jgi:hypothetical protein